MVTIELLTLNINQGDANRRFAEGLLRFGYLETMPMPTEFASADDYIQTEQQIAVHKASKRRALQDQALRRARTRNRTTKGNQK